MSCSFFLRGAASKLQDPMKEYFPTLRISPPISGPQAKIKINKNGSWCRFECRFSYCFSIDFSYNFQSNYTSDLFVRYLLLFSILKGRYWHWKIDSCPYSCSSSNGPMILLPHIPRPGRQKEDQAASLPRLLQEMGIADWSKSFTLKQWHRKWRILRVFTTEFRRKWFQLRFAWDFHKIWIILVSILGLLWHEIECWESYLLQIIISPAVGVKKHDIDKNLPKRFWLAIAGFGFFIF